LFAAFAMAATVSAQVGYTYDSASNSNFQKAFDGDTNSKFEGNNLAGNWLIIKTTDSQPHVVKSYAITTHDDGSWPNRAPKTWTLEGSNDKSNWTLIDKVTNDPIQNQNYTTFTFNGHFNFNAYTYIRFTMLTMKGTGWTQIGEFAVTDVAEAELESFRAGKKTEYQSKLTGLQTEANNFMSTLGEDDPWTQEYNSLVNNTLPNLLNSTTDFNYGKFNDADRFVSLKNQFTGSNYSAIDGTATWGDGHWTQLFDGKDGREGRAGTKWGAHFASDDAKQYVIFRVKAAFKPFFYKLVTGGDTKTYKGRNWKTWNVYGGNFDTLADATYDLSKWTKLDARVDITEEYLPFENNYPASFNFNQYPEGLPETYYYYMVEIVDSYTRSQGTQMNEMALCTQEEFEATRAPLVAEFDDFDTTRPIEPDYEDDLTQFNTVFAELKNTADAVQLTKLFNQCVALRTLLEANMDWVEFNAEVALVEGVYQLGSAANLAFFSTIVNEGRGNLNAVLTADVDMDGVAMAPIGTPDIPYTGSFNGQGYAVKNYTYNHSDEGNVGLFGYISGATIQNVMLKGANINGNANAAGLVGNAQNGSVIQNCAVLNTYVEGRDHVAAIAGNLAGGSAVRNNLSDADIYSRSFQAGGMVGTVLSGAIVEKNLFTGTVKCNGGNASGLVSLIDADDANPTIKNNVVAAVSVEGGTTFTLVNNSGGRAATYANNFILDTTVYSTGAKSVSNENDQNGKQISLSEATTPEFFAETLGWDMTNDWQFVARGVFPVLAWMEAVVPTETITVTSAGYATYFTQNELDFSTLEPTVSAYVPQVVSGSKTYVHLEPITYVPANFGIIIKAAEGTYDIPYSAILTKEISNDLKEAPAEFVANGNQYILANGSEGIGFYKAEGTITEGKGYIEVVDAGVKALFFVEDDATGIKDINDLKDSNDVIYNLAGQRIQKMQKGVNIVGNKKVLK